MVRFREYISTIVNGQGDDVEVFPLVAMNPMGKDHCAAQLDQYLALDAENITLKAQLRWVPEPTPSYVTARVVKQRMKDLPPALRRSMTFDNGKEFAEHHQLTRRSGLQVYFADPYASWQRGTNENTNGLLRQYFPKGTDFTRISHRQVARVEQLLNERPRKRLGYRTPTEVLAVKLRRN